jgi:hypothetical protein
MLPHRNLRTGPARATEEHLLAAIERCIHWYLDREDRSAAFNADLHLPVCPFGR